MPVYRHAVLIITPVVKAVPSDFNKRICCGKAELSVLIAGAIVNISNTELELWLRETMSLSYEHIVKKIEKDWGHKTESSTLPSDTNNPPPSDMNNQIPPPPSETNNQISDKTQYFLYCQNVYIWSLTEGAGADRSLL
ncbi:hypothetical protein RhiirB3_391047 [Rhizophagus irregularis]|nr:hypothetical protein RhiirB3_391047 [Rhizophagus irregularis]